MSTNHLKAQIKSACWIHSDPNRPVTCPLYLFWYTLYLKNYKLTILGNRVTQVGVREGIIFGN
jgi:hypothetical protein